MKASVKRHSACEPPETGVPKSVMLVPPRVGPDTGLTDVACGLPYCSKVCALAENCCPLSVTSNDSGEGATGGAPSAAQDQLASVLIRIHTDVPSLWYALKVFFNSFSATGASGRAARRTRHRRAWLGCQVASNFDSLRSITLSSMVPPTASSPSKAAMIACSVGTSGVGGVPWTLSLGPTHTSTIPSSFTSWKSLNLQPGRVSSSAALLMAAINGLLGRTASGAWQ